MTDPHRVVIVGAGFGGTKAALELARDEQFQVTLITERDSFEYHAALYRSVTGRSKLEVVVPLEEIFADLPVRWHQDSVRKLDAAKKTVTTAAKKIYEYDTLIIATGNVTSYFGIKGLPEFSYGMKSIAEAMRLKDHLHDELLHPERLDSHYVVVGAGPTGVELAGELTRYLNHLYAKHRAKGKTFHVDLVEAAPSILPNAPRAMSARIQERLKGMGISIFTDTAVRGERADTLELPHGDIKTHTVVWTAGVTGAPLFANNASVFNLSKGNRVEVGPSLEAADGIYVLGDAAHTQFAGWAQTALYDGWYVADHLKRLARDKKPRKYKPGQPISAIPVGHAWAAVAWGHIRFYGYPGWTIRRYLDYKLFKALLPHGLARRTWRAGTTSEESCPICAK